jgi:hypothetical protein
MLENLSDDLRAALSSHQHRMDLIKDKVDERAYSDHAQEMQEQAELIFEREVQKLFHARLARLWTGDFEDLGATQEELNGKLRGDLQDAGVYESFARGLRAAQVSVDLPPADATDDAILGALLFLARISRLCPQARPKDFPNPRPIRPPGPSWQSS